MRKLVLFVGFLGACATRAEDFGAASAAGACEWVARCGGLESSGYASLDDCVDQTVAGSAAYYKCEIELCEFDPKAVTKCLATYDKMACSEADSETLNSDMETLNTNCKAVFTGCDTVDVTACMGPATLRSR